MKKTKNGERKDFDIVAVRKRQKRLRRTGKFLIFLVVAGTALALYSMRDTWFASLEGIGTRYQNVTQNENLDGEGYFPLTISGGMEYYADFVGNRMFLLCDKYLYIYASNGSIRDTRQHGYSNPIMKASNSRCLLYSCNGMSFRVDNADSMLYEHELDQPILFASMAGNGSVVVVTESETFACRLTVYDVTGKLIYTRECVDRIVDACLVDGGCITASLGAENGEMVTILKSFDFSGEEEKWSTDPLAAFCWKVYPVSGGGAFVIGDSKCAYYSSTGALLSTYNFTGTLIDCAFENDRAAVLLKNENQRKSELLLFADQNAAPVSVKLPSMFRSVILDNEKAYILGTSSICGYAFSGEQMSSTDVEDAYEKILKNGRYFYLLGYDSVDRLEP